MSVAHLDIASTTPRYLHWHEPSLDKTMYLEPKDREIKIRVSITKSNKLFRRDGQTSYLVQHTFVLMLGHRFFAPLLKPFIALTPLHQWQI